MPQRYLLFTAGPVAMSEEILEIGREQPPYFRTEAYSAFMQEAERRFLRLLTAPEGSRAVFLNASGTGAMEAAVAGLLTPDDRALVIDGGSFGRRFAQLTAFYGIPTETLSLAFGQRLTEERLNAVCADGLTALLVNLHETSSGTLYDLGLLSRYCDAHGLLLIVDAVSAFIAEALDMSACRADAVLTASQKALACAPGIAPLALSPRGLERMKCVPSKCYYLNLQEAFENAKRGQPPFTPAESVMMQVAARLEGLMDGGMERERAQMARRAEAFRARITDLPFTLVSQSPSNAVTAISPRAGVSAHGIFETLMNDYHICVCPNGGAQRDTVLRVGHMGALTDEDYERLFAALNDLQGRKLL